MVIEPTINQLVIFLITILTGALLLLLYDFYAAFGHVLRLGKVGFALGDLLYWLLALGLVFTMLLSFNQGEMRFHVLLGLGLGSGLYFLLMRSRVRRLIIRVLEFSLRMMGWVLGLIMKLTAVLLWPFRLLLRGFCYPFRLLRQLLRTGRLQAAKGLKGLGHRWSKKQPPKN